MKKTSLLFTFIFLILFLGENIAMAQLVTNNVLQRVFLIKYKKSIGSSFTLDVDGKQYLITAKHILKGIQTKDQIEIFHNNKLRVSSSV
jgi:hypothetical protein